MLTPHLSFVLSSLAGPRPAGDAAGYAIPMRDDRRYDDRGSSRYDDRDRYSSRSGGYDDRRRY